MVIIPSHIVQFVQTISEIPCNDNGNYFKPEFKRKQANGYVSVLFKIQPKSSEP